MDTGTIPSKTFREAILAAGQPFRPGGPDSFAEAGPRVTMEQLVAHPPRNAPGSGSHRAPVARNDVTLIPGQASFEDPHTLHSRIRARAARGKCRESAGRLRDLPDTAAEPARRGDGIDQRRHPRTQADSAHNGGDRRRRDRHRIRVDVCGDWRPRHLDRSTEEAVGVPRSRDCRRVIHQDPMPTSPSGWRSPSRGSRPGRKAAPMP